MDGLRAKGESVVLITSGPGELAKQAEEKGHRVYMAPMPPIGLASIKAFKQWKALLKEIGGSLLHAQTPRAAFYAGVAGKRASLPSVFHCRVAARDWKLDPILVRLVSCVVCNSRATAARFEAWPWLKPKVILNGLDVQIAGIDKRNTHKKNLLFVGRFSEEKQPEIVWQVFSRLAEKFPNLALHFVGDADPLNPSLISNLKQLIASSPYHARVHWAGPQQDVSPWYGLADIVIMPSKYEGFGRVLVESMAHRVPVVAFRVGGIPEVLEDGRQGVLIEPYDVDALCGAVEELLDSDAKRAQMGEAGAARAEKFSLEAHVNAVLAHYSVICGDNVEH